VYWVWDPLCLCFKLHKSPSLGFAGSGLDSPFSFYFSLPFLARVRYLFVFDISLRINHIYQNFSVEPSEKEMSSNCFF